MLLDHLPLIVTNEYIVQIDALHDDSVVLVAPAICLLCLAARWTKP